MSQQADTLKVRKQNLEVTTTRGVKFMLYVNETCKTDSAVAEIKIKRLRSGKVYSIKAQVVQPQILNNIATFELMMDKRPAHLVVYIDDENNIVRLMTYKSYDRMMKKRANQDELRRMECWEVECHQDSTKRYDGEYQW